MKTSHPDAGEKEMTKQLDLVVVIFYKNHPAFRFRCNSKGLKDAIRYWMGKSPGMYRNEVEKIICYYSTAETDVTHVLNELDKERFEREEEYRQREQRAEFERLREIYEPGPRKV